MFNIFKKKVEPIKVDTVKVESLTVKPIKIEPFSQTPIKIEPIKIEGQLTFNEDSYISGFKNGFNKAFNMVLELVRMGISKSEEYIRDTAITDTMANINSMIERRIEELDKKELKPKHIISMKMNEFRQKLLKAEREGDKENIVKYTHYTEVLQWELSDERK